MRYADPNEQPLFVLAPYLPGLVHVGIFSCILPTKKIFPSVKGCLHFSFKGVVYKTCFFGKIYIGEKKRPCSVCLTTFKRDTLLCCIERSTLAEHTQLTVHNINFQIRSYYHRKIRGAKLIVCR